MTTTPERFYLIVQDSSNRSAVVSYPGPEIMRGGWTEWRIPLREFQGVNLAGVQKLTIGVGDRAHPKAGGSGVIYLDDIGVGHPLAWQ